MSSKRKPRAWKVSLSDKEINYIEAALRYQIIDYAQGPLAGMGNLPHLLRFTKQVYRKFRLLRGWPKCMRINYLPKRGRAVRRVR